MFLSAVPAPAAASPLAAVVPWLIILILLASLSAVCRMFKPAVKGFIGECAVDRLVLSRLGKGYKVYKDLYLPRPDGNGTTQLDHVVVSVHGIFVIETKNYSGWIFGSERDARWTQCLKGGFKTQFQNPLLQNKLHVNALRLALNLPQSCFHSIVHFVGACTFKTPLPDNVIRSGLRDHILQHQHPLLSASQAGAACRRLDAFVDDKAELKTLHRWRRAARS
jgi:hypothetical protein